MMACSACGDDLPALRSQGRPRKWCSEACRIWRMRHPDEMRIRACTVCGESLAADKQRFCSLRCNNVAAGRVRLEPLSDRQCAVCSVAFTPNRVTVKYCSPECKAKRPRIQRYRKRPFTDADRDRAQRRRARKRGSSTGDPVRKAEIAKRDRWCCGICGKCVKRDLQWPHPMSASLDHIVPLSQQGPHTPANVRLAHLVCNTARSNRGGGEQLMLVG